MAEDFDLDRVINDPAYRRQVIARLNGSAVEEPALADLEPKKNAPVPQSFVQPISD